MVITDICQQEMYVNYIENIIHNVDHCAENISLQLFSYHGSGKKQDIKTGYTCLHHLIQSKAKYITKSIA